MKDLLFLKIKAFLEKYYIEGKPLLLAFSGGPDSTALLHLLKKCCRFFPLQVNVVHVDHRWREESTRQAKRLQKSAEDLGFAFFLEELLPPSSQQNLEEKARNERLKIFSAMYREGGYQALLLAHHAEDQAETVLKRILEGASLFSLGGMEEVGQMEEMVVWRPMLSVRKRDLLEWLKERGVKALEDPTNKDPKFLRARMRSALFPEIKKIFGKDATLPLGKMGHSAQELKGYLEKKAEPYLKKAQKEKGGVVLDLSSDLPLEKVELKTVLKILCQKVGAVLSFEAIETLCKLLNTKAARKMVAVKSHEFHVHLGELKIKLKEQ